jgi:hypothetical protein
VQRILIAFTLVLTAVSASYAADEFNGVPHPHGTMAFTTATTLGNCRTCAWIAAEGPITERTPRDFEMFLKSQEIGDAERTIVLNSGGGSLVAGLELGEAIHRHKFSTRVGQTIAFDPLAQQIIRGGCYSACAYAFLGGRLRSATAGELGFHQFQTPAGFPDADEGSTQRVMGLLIAYFRKMSIDPALLAYAAATNPADLFRPDDDTMFKLGVINARGIPTFSGWSIEPFGSGAAVTAFIPATGTEDQDQDDDQTIRIYCRAKMPQHVFMMVTWQWAEPRPKDAARHNEAMHTMVFGSSVTIGGRLVRKSAGSDAIVDAHVDASDRYFLTYEFSADEFAAATRAGRLEVRIEAAHALGYYGFRFDPPMQGLAELAKVAFKSCVQ